MPRRNGRRQHAGGDGGVLHRLEEELHRRQSDRGQRPPLAAGAPLRHKGHCQGPRVGTFIGTRGDLMARCQACGAAALVQPNSQTEGDPA